MDPYGFLMLFSIIIVFVSGGPEESPCRQNETTCKDGMPQPQNLTILERKCTLPPYPPNGVYTVKGDANARPGDLLHTAVLNYNCSAGYVIQPRKSLVVCYNGIWYKTASPECIKVCHLKKHDNVDYRCIMTGKHGEEGTRNCNEHEPLGTVVRVDCKRNYYSNRPLRAMRCHEHGWDSQPVCVPECGRTVPVGTELMIGGRDARRGEMPWHVGIYELKNNSYEQICSGTLVSNDRVLTAAHCFVREGKRKSPSRYAIAVGKLQRDWNNNDDLDVQKSKIKNIKMPKGYLGSATNFENDIAILILKTPIQFGLYAMPACLDFSSLFDDEQLQPGRLGKAAGWGLTASGKPSTTLKVAQLSYVSVGQCIADSPNSYREFITDDKICAICSNIETMLNRGDSGGGLFFSDIEKGVERFYQRGIVSMAPLSDNIRSHSALTSFTHVQKHKDFILESL